jgi:aspartate kinase
MAEFSTISKVAEIIKSDSDRRYIIVSAPGKRVASDPKITDTLYKCHEEVISYGVCPSFEIIRHRFTEIAEDFDIGLDIRSLLDEIEYNIIRLKSADYAASIGEYLSARILAEVIGFEFVDAKELIKFDSEGRFDAEYTNDVTEKVLSVVKYAVIPGFYGCTPDCMIKTFSRGGSDVSGAIIARAVGADVYENWTDVDGFLTTDPRVVDKPRLIDNISYKELRELSYMGANVLHPEAIFPVAKKNIPINIKNTFNPSHPGTMIVPAMDESKDKIVTGIAGKKGFTVIQIEKSMMNNEVGFARRILSVLEHFNISFEHMPSGIDTLSIVISDNELNGKRDALIKHLSELMSLDNVEVNSNMALIATVGHGMSKKQGTAARLFTALASNNVNVRMIDQGSSEMNIIVGVESDDYEAAIRALYKEFID